MRVCVCVYVGEGLGMGILPKIFNKTHFEMSYNLLQGHLDGLNTFVGNICNTEHKKGTLYPSWTC